MLAYNLVTLVAPADASRLQDLLRECSDYYELHEGWATPADAGEFELTAIPPTSTTDDLYVFAFEDARGVLKAAAQVVRNYPRAGTWWIGQLVVTPELRGGGVGSMLLRRVMEAAVAGGASSMQLAVSVRNPRAQKFWEAAGFRDTGIVRCVTARSGHADAVRVLSRDLTAPMAAAP